MHRYKAQPGVTASSPAGETFPIYAAVSTAEETFYEWSNDNNVYTEIAHPATIEVDDSYLVFFSGEVPDGLNGAKTGAVLNAPRNAAFVRVPKDLTSDAVLSDGPVDFGGFYDFTGKWTPQTDEGITLLTEFTTLAQNVMHMKTARLAPGKNVITWELWEPATFNQTQFMVVDDTGSVVVPPTTLNFPLRLPADDEPRVVGSRTVFYSGTVDGKLARYELCVQDGCPAQPKTAEASLLQKAAEERPAHPDSARPLTRGKIMQAVQRAASM